MGKLIAYLILWMLFLLAASVGPTIWSLPEWYARLLPYIQSTLMGGLGGVLYCLRATYLHCCFLKDWDESWLVWYYLRPLSSGITGLVSFFFLKAGLLVLDAKEAESISFGYYAIAFIAGYNVDNFLKKLENVAQSLFSIDKSTTSKDKRPSDG